ncbi:conserved hypothetical protein [Desulfamplus magnetovallimortis]|uniref:Uncharacterized protein n=1 Tax=Desulfamplus magnetovallimortis TaxID=1246637 RepID=A0A1W1H743_9BACT|nr:hypothetical protein [Desulfamplus magnetovallimortis]SLM28277.1 conserved hypothetical protein [Desulfamplus magnetovallimortis]
MNLKENRILRLKDNIEQIVNRLINVSSDHAVNTTPIIKQCRQCLASVPAVDSPVYVHITGTDKSFKTSYLLDLFDNDDLRKLFAVKVHNTSENTAVPCLVEPSSNVARLTIRQIAISSGEILHNDLSADDFARLYDLSMGAVPDDYLIQVLLPEDETPMTLPIIEYPGIKEGADAQEAQRTLHQTFQRNLIHNLARYPGILVACFQHKVAIPPGHPMDIILKKYGEILKTSYSGNKLPLVLSLQGGSAISGYCGNTHVEKDIAADFKSHKSFDTTIQLINPYNRTYPVTFSEPGPHVTSWIRHLSRYKDVHEIRYNIELDGGITWSRKLLEEICQNSNIQDALDNIFLKPWMVEAESCLTAANECLNEIESYDEVKEVREKIRLAIINGRYRDIRTFFKNEISIQTDGIVDNHQRFWAGIIYQYLIQFFDEDDRCRAMADVMWKNIVNRLDHEGKNFISTREEDLVYIIMNIAALYVPNALIRGDVDIFGISMKPSENGDINDSGRDKNHENNPFSESQGGHNFYSATPVNSTETFNESSYEFQGDPL